MLGIGEKIGENNNIQPETCWQVRTDYLGENIENRNQ